MKTRHNDPCSSGSGKKNKNSCAAKDEAAAHQRKTGNDKSPETKASEPASAANIPEPAGEEAWDRDSRANHPRPCFVLPQLAPKEQVLVDRWWKGTMPVYSKMNPGVLLARILEFLDSHPRLFPHLRLQEECLFELAGALRRQGQATPYIGLLKRLRVEQTETYLPCFGYYDYDIVEELTLAGRRAEIPVFLNYFKQYPDVDPDNCHNLIKWLAWVDYEDELMDLAKAVAIPLLESPNVIGGEFAIEWVLLREYFPFFEARDASLEAAAKIQQAHRTHLPAGEEPVPMAQLHSVLKKVIQMPRGWVNAKPPQDKKTFLNNVHWDFVGYLHREKRCGWVRAIYLAERLHEYLFRDRKPHVPFDLRENVLEAHIAGRYQSFFCVDGPLALAFLQAVVHYADYLAYHQAPTRQTRDQVMESCQALYPKVAAAIEGGDSSLRLYPSFEALCPP